MRGVDYVFHAAALKQVPSCEFFPMEAVKPMSWERKILLMQPLRIKVSKICLSTDKAAYPINAMGISKR
jgi:UDP-glucose 4-epimerase